MQKDKGYAKKKVYPCPEAWEKRKRKKKRKDSPYLKIKNRVM